MVCTNHPQMEATGFCVYCGKPFCSDCLVEVKGRLYCKADIGNVIDEARNSTASHASPINIVNTNTNAYGFAPSKSRIVAFLLCLFMGCMGIHRFYVGKIGSGLLYFFTCGFFGIGWFFDLLLILFGVFRDNYGRPLV